MQMLFQTFAGNIETACAQVHPQVRLFPRERSRDLRESYRYLESIIRHVGQVESVRSPGLASLTKDERINRKLSLSIIRRSRHSGAPCDDYVVETFIGLTGEEHRPGRVNSRRRRRRRRRRGDVNENASL